MKLTSLNRLFLGLLAGAALLATSSTTKAVPLDDTITYTNKFDVASDTASWIYWYGINPGNSSMAWDGTKDAANDTNSGSLVFECTFPNSSQQTWFGTWHNRWGYDTDQRHDATKYTNIVFDILVATNSVLSTAGTFGDLQLGFYDGPGYGSFANKTIPAIATNGWVHLTMPIDPTVPGMGSVSGIRFQIQSYNNYANPIGYVKFWMDNLKMVVSPVIPPPPTISSVFTTPVQGLNLLSYTANGGEFQRTSISYNTHTGVGWLGSATPVTYAVTITNFPSSIYTNYQAHIFVTTGNAPTIYNAATDYSETNVIFFDIHNNPDGTGSASFRYKVNEEQSNSNMFGVEYVGTASAGTLTNITAPTVFGTWSITFNQDTNVTLNGPGGATKTFSMRPAAVANFTEPLNVIFGAQPNRQSNGNPLGNVGQSVVLAAIGITNGGTTIINDNFMTDTTFDTVNWFKLAGDVNSIQFIPPGSAKWIKWTLPDADFGLQVSTNLANKNAWVTLTGPDAGGGTLQNYTAAGTRLSLLPTSVLGSGSQNYFRLLKQNFSKLQLLMPGETAAPGTPTGKTGTPTAQQVGVAFTVTVNAVDSQWYLINTATDTVHIDSANVGAGLPADAALFAGTGTWTVTFGTAGTATVIASDVSDNTKTSSTSPSTTVNP